MKHVRLLSLAVLLVLVSGLTAQVKIAGEKTYNLHEPIVLKAEGAGTKAQCLWDIDGAAQVVESGQTLYVWAPAGRYTVKLTAIDFDSKTVTRMRLSFTVEGAPGPGPEPDPPGPGPKPPPTPLPDGALGLIKTSRDGLATVWSATRTEEAKRLAQANRTHAAAVAAGAFADAKAILEGWRAANRKALNTTEQVPWATWATLIKTKVETIHKEGKLPGNNEWSAAFREIAAGLDGGSTKGGK